MRWSWTRRSPADAGLTRLERAVRRLDRVTRAVFLLHRLEGLGYPEIAGRLGITVEEVERRIAGAMLRLAQAVIPDGSRAD